MEKLVTEAELAKLPIEILYVQKQTLDRVNTYYRFN